MPYKNKSKKPADGLSARPVTIIAIDGPAGSGKSTVAKELAARFGFLYVDTGAMYRALTLGAINSQIDLNDQRALTKLAQAVNIQLKMQNNTLKVELDGKDVSKEIRKQSVTEKVRYLARVPAVRKEMVKLQRRLTRGVKGAVLEGRDIGTVVFPHAKYKFYLDAQVNERIKRRHQELAQMSQRACLQDVASDIKQRDASDMTRSVAPLVKAKDAIYIDTTKLKIKDVIEQISRRCAIG